MTDMTDTTTETQNGDQLGDSGKKALESERTARKDAERRAREADARIAEFEREQARRTVASEKGLSAEQAKLLAADDEDAMRIEADALLAAFREEPDPRRRPVERMRPGAVPSAEPVKTAGEIADNIVKGW
jgi:hypothetical protein